MSRQTDAPRYKPPAGRCCKKYDCAQFGVVQNGRRRDACTPMQPRIVPEWARTITNRKRFTEERACIT